MRNSYLPPASQPWAKDIERAISVLQNKTASVENTANGAQRTLEQSMPTIGFANAIPDRIDSVEQVAQSAFVQAGDAMQTADGANTWSERDPINPPSTDDTLADIPHNDNAMWFTTDSEGTTLRMWQWVPSDMDPDAENYVTGQWEQQKFNTDTIAPEAISAELLAKSVSDDIETAKEGASEAIAAAGAANTAATNAQSAANAANQAALEAAGVAAGKGKIIYATSAPTGDDRNSNNLWINTAGGANTPMRWDGTNWVAVSDKKAVDAAYAAAAAQSKADQAFTAAQDAGDVATAANLAANHAQTTADGKNTVYYQTAEPAGADLNLKVNDVWYDADGGYKMYRYSGTEWVAAPLGSAAIATLDAGKITTGTLGADRIAANSITAAKLVSGTITASSGVIADLAITNAMIANGAIQNAKIANLDAGKITTGTLNADHIAANSITADKLNANAFTGQTFTGSVFTAGGGALPKVLVGPSSGIPGTGDQYGVYISTPNSNAQGSAALSVTPTGPYLQFKDGTNAETFYVDGNGNIRIKNLTDGGMVDLTKLSTQKWVYNRTNTTWIMNFNSTSWSDWGWLTPMLFAVSSPTGRLRVDHGIWFDNIESGDTAWMQYQVGVYTADPSNNTDVRGDLLNQRAIAPAYSSIGGSGYPTWTTGSEVISVTPNQTYYIRAIYKRKAVAVARTANIQNYWVSVTPA